MQRLSLHKGRGRCPGGALGPPLLDAGGTLGDSRGYRQGMSPAVGQPRGGMAVIYIDRLDHLVLTVADIARTCEFYSRVLGMEVVTFGAGRTALGFGRQKINLHQAGREFEPKAVRPAPGSGDLCLITHAPMARVLEHLAACGVETLGPPDARTGATGPLLSVYFRDPDGNLVEVSNQQ